MLLRPESAEQVAPGHPEIAVVDLGVFVLTLVMPAMGFSHPEQEGLIKELSIAVDTRGNIAVDPGTNRIADTNIFASGDAVSGASLVVRAMASGRKAAAAIDKYLHPHKS